MKEKLKNNSAMDNGQWIMRNAKNFRSPKLSIANFTLFILLLIIPGCTNKETADEDKDTYLCPMHPTVVSDRPSTCPVCGMDLVRKARPGEEVEITDDLAKLIKSPNETVAASIKTIRGEFKSMPLHLKLSGIVTYDTREIFTIPTRIGGRLEEIFLKYNFQPVKKGQKVAEVYSPELVNAQQELVYLIQKDAENTPLIEASKNKLALLGATSQQLETLVKSQKVVYTFAIYSQYNGYVITDTQPAPSAPTSTATSVSGDMGMGGEVSSSVDSRNQNGSPAPATSMLRVGNYVSAGQALFRVLNSNSIWLEFNVPSSQASQLKKGEQLNLLTGGQTKKLRIDFIEPFSQTEGNFIRIRSYYQGGDLPIGQLIEATLSSTSKETLWLPKEAVLDLGASHVLFAKERGQFKPKEVEIGIRSGDYVEITKGLTSGDEVASNAQYLIDSESFVKATN
jgi:membrane fusion protein, copper/silver efflux system